MTRPAPEEIREAEETLGVLVAQGRTAGKYGRALDVLMAATALPDLMGATEAAAELGVTTSNLAKIANMPEPLYTLRAGRFYDAEDVRALAQERKA